MTAIGIIGSGNIGSQLARAFAHAGHDITIANSRGPETLEELVGEINAATASHGGGGTVTAGTVEQAAQAGDTVVVTIPLKAVPSIPAPLLAGRTVIDTNNYYPQRDGQIAELDDESLTTAEYVARHFSGATVVKAFNHIPSDDITGQAQPSGTENRRALTVHADDESAKGLVSSLIDEIGFDPYDGGTLADSWRIQRDTPAYGPRFTAAELEAKLAEAKRYRDM
ncbi:NAD(P)-binding domain-containing protein [Microcella daejeonensis]|uniref:NADPH-dependent F420 reductase n=1 Tax=Microcella daejeonensis TaxID=2994971 RepID=UPI002271F397|nr:NAD(P)-binding domain-containing protein [Microcella daejeonensis]WAB84421.1 NAD(P)-binding domain-containing protein [Microcella daejeonensis]